MSEHRLIKAAKQPAAMAKNPPDADALNETERRTHEQWLEEHGRAIIARIRALMEKKDV